MMIMVYILEIICMDCKIGVMKTSIKTMLLILDTSDMISVTMITMALMISMAIAMTTAFNTLLQVSYRGMDTTIHTMGTFRTIMALNMECKI